MKKIKITSLFLLLLPLLLAMFNSCSSRIEEPVMLENATVIYPSKQDDDISAEISFCRRINDKTGELTGEGMVFSMIENGIMYTVADFQNQYRLLETGLMFHIEWIGPNGKSVFNKQIEVPPGDSSTSINSSISITPEKRDAGDYIFKLYYFRELIAEKKFVLLPELIVTPAVAEALAPQITLYRYVSKKTGKLIGEGTVFEIKEKRKLRAKVEVVNRFAFGEQELMFHINWVGPDGEQVYRKRYDFYPGDSSATIKGSISISPEKRIPGDYRFQLLLFNTLIAEQEFELE